MQQPYAPTLTSLKLKWTFQSDSFQSFGAERVPLILSSAILKRFFVIVSNQYFLLAMCVKLCVTCSSVFVMSRVYTSFIESTTLNLRFPTPIILGVYSSFTLRHYLSTRGLYLVAIADNKTVKCFCDGSNAWRGLDLVTLSKRKPSLFSIVWSCEARAVAELP